jgi:hypothetical protein
MANDLISHKEWMKRTALIGRRRSPLLKELDENLEIYDKYGGSAVRWKVGQALEAWQKDKQPRDWKSSSRNKNNRAFEDLAKLLNNKVNQGDAEAYKALEEHSQDFIKTLFEKRKVELSGKLITGYESAASVYDTYTLTSRAVKTASNMADKAFTEDLFLSALGEAYTDPGMSELIAEIFGETLGELVKSMTPGVGLIKSASMTVWSSLKVYSQAKLGVNMRGAHVAFNPGDPEAAFLAVQVLTKQELAKSSYMLVTHGTEAGFKTSGIFFDGATASTAIAGTVGTLTRLIYTLKCLRQDWKEKKEANILLADPSTITHDLFNKNPLLGCYFIACATDSVLLNFMFGKNMALPSFMDRIEKSVKQHLEPTRKAATHCIFNHRMQLSGGNLPKLSVQGGKGQIVVRNPATYQHITSSVMNFLKRRPTGYYK